ncbi:MAG: GDP-mannose 4,6-dehydratase, partial [Nitrospirae bacterium]|nr:GDP-mannose 4,6-dehydratase [Nitrospirota bacterium]
MKALITGIDGFVGSHLTSLLLDEGTQVFGLVHDMGRVHRLQAVAGRVDLVQGDATRSEDLVRVIERAMPDEIYRLAGAAHVQGSWKT